MFGTQPESRIVFAHVPVVSRVIVILPFLIPGALSQGETEDETLANIKDAIMTLIDMMKEQGEPVPTEPAEIHELVVA